MAKCKRCGKSRIFLKLNSEGLCENCATLVKFEAQKAALQNEITQLSQTLADQQPLYQRTVERIEREATAQVQMELHEMEQKKAAIVHEIAQQNDALERANREREKVEKAIASNSRKLEKLVDTLKSAKYTLSVFDNAPYSNDANLSTEIDNATKSIEEELAPTVSISLQCMDLRQLRKAFTANKKNIEATYEKYKSRYTTKTNMAIYQLMTIALEAELQNVLYTIGYGKLDKAVDSIKEIISKYYAIASDGNQSIAATLKKYVGEMEYFFIEAVKIEYEYYVQKERAKEEQRAIREQMRQEAEERKELERQQRLMEKEEEKYKTEIDSVQQMLAAEKDDEKMRALQERIEKLQCQLAAASEQRSEIVKRQNGKAGNVYIISNLGSFGEDVFKIGMTRRMDPQERVNELGDASVPFPFDVHSFIFSDNAVELETSLHHRLNDRRVNKVNLRKEFFNVSLDELEELVYSLEPTAEFKRTMLATQFRQSQSISHVPDENTVNFEDDELDE